MRGIEVRDAVIRGDRSIIRNLELATKKTNNNMKACPEVGLGFRACPNVEKLVQKASSASYWVLFLQNPYP